MFSWAYLILRFHSLSWPFLLYVSIFHWCTWTFSSLSIFYDYLCIPHAYWWSLFFPSMKLFSVSSFAYVIPFLTPCRLNRYLKINRECREEFDSSECHQTSTWNETSSASLSRFQSKALWWTSVSALSSDSSANPMGSVFYNMFCKHTLSSSFHPWSLC